MHGGKRIKMEMGQRIISILEKIYMKGVVHLI